MCSVSEKYINISDNIAMKILTEYNISYCLPTAWQIFYNLLDICSLHFIPQYRWFHIFPNVHLSEGLCLNHNKIASLQSLLFSYLDLFFIMTHITSRNYATYFLVSLHFLWLSVDSIKTVNVLTIGLPVLKQHLAQIDIIKVC